jgi:hypothetical protein
LAEAVIADRRRDPHDNVTRAVEAGRLARNHRPFSCASATLNQSADRFSRRRICPMNKVPYSSFVTLRHIKGTS